MRKERKGFIGVDFDKTLSYYTQWEGPDKLGPPIPAMVDRVKDWLKRGRLVKIFTARVSSEHTSEQVMLAENAIRAWCKEHIGVELDVTANKSMHMYEFWDDRAVAVEPNTGRILDNG